MDITKEQFQAYKRVQESGVTNMFAISLVAQLSMLNKDEVLDIMEHYEELNKKY